MENKPKKKSDWFDTILWTIFIICIIISVSQLTYDETSMINKFVITHDQGSGGTFAVAFNLTSTVFSAQNDITIDVMARPDIEFLQSYPDLANKIDTLYIYFPSATTGYETFKNGVAFSPTMRLTKEPNGYFYGHYVIQYPQEGDKCFVISSKTTNGLPDICKSEEAFVHISSLDSTTQYKNNKIQLTLTGIIVAFSIIASRDPLRRILRIKDSIV